MHNEMLAAICESTDNQVLAEAIVQIYGTCFPEANPMCEGLLNKLAKGAAIGALAFNSANANMFGNYADVSNAATQQLVGTPNTSYINTDDDQQQIADRIQELQHKIDRKSRYRDAFALAQSGHPETLEKLIINDFIAAMQNGDDTQKLKKMALMFSRGCNTNTYGKLIEIEDQMTRQQSQKVSSAQAQLDALEDQIMTTIEQLSARPLTSTAKNIANARFRKYKALYDKLVNDGASGNYPEWETDFMSVINDK